MSKRGKLIVFEGADGSGKTTQSKLLISFLSKRNIPSAYISFPRYEESMWAKMVRRFLSGDFGKLSKVDPYFASMLYAGDRMSAANQIKKLLSSGKIVVCNRYIGSNIGHMAAKIKSQSEKSKYIEWLEKLEYGENKIPKEDLVIFLHVPISVSKKLMSGRQLDIHEDDLAYQEKVLEVYEDICKKKNYWVKVDCTKVGKILATSEIQKKVLEVLNVRKLIKSD